VIQATEKNFNQSYDIALAHAVLHGTFYQSLMNAFAYGVNPLVKRKWRELLQEMRVQKSLWPICFLQPSDGGAAGKSATTTNAAPAGGAAAVGRSSSSNKAISIEDDFVTPRTTDDDGGGGSGRDDDLTKHQTSASIGMT